MALTDQIHVHSLLVQILTTLLRPPDTDLSVHVNVENELSLVFTGHSSEDFTSVSACVIALMQIEGETKQKARKA